MKRNGCRNYRVLSKSCLCSLCQPQLVCLVKLTLLRIAGDKPTAKDKGTADKDKEQAEQRRRAEASGDKGARQRDEAMSYWNDDTWLGWDDEEEGPTAPADDEESKQRLQEKLWTLGQGGLPFVVVGEDPSKSCYRPLRVQQNPVISVRLAQNEHTLLAVVERQSKHDCSYLLCAVWFLPIQYGR